VGEFSSNRNINAILMLLLVASQIDDYEITNRSATLLDLPDISVGVSSLICDCGRGSAKDLLNQVLITQENDIAVLIFDGGTYKAEPEVPQSATPHLS